MNNPRHLVLGLALAAVTASAHLAAQGGLSAEAGWSVVRQDFEVSIDAANGSMEVAGVLELQLDGLDRSAGPTVGINSKSRSMAWKSLTCEGAKIEVGVRHSARKHRRMARVRFAEPKSRGDRIELRFACEYRKPGGQIVVSPGIALASWVEAWYPVPDPAAGSSLGQATRAKGRTKFNLPRGWSAVTNGELVSHEDLGDRTVEVWSTSRALSRSFAAGPYRRIVHETDSLTASIYLLSDRAIEPRSHAQALSNAIGAMEKRWGPYPFKSFSIAEVPGRIGTFGASSQQGFILVKPHFLAVKGGNLPLFAHEASHAWWGNTVGAIGPGRLLCTESLAQYGAVVAIEELEGKAAATEFLRFSRAGYISNQCARGYFEVARRGKDEPLRSIVSGTFVGHLLSDSKGHWVYHMLRRRIGDEVFFGTLRRLIHDYDGRTLSLDAMREAFAVAAPEAGLQQFFSQWLDRPGAPVLQATCVREAGHTLLGVQQLQKGEPFVLDLDIEATLQDGRKLRRQVRVGANKRETLTLDVPAGTEVTEVALDPDHALLIWCPEYGAAPDGVVDDDPVVPAADRSVYLGAYDVVGRELAVHVVLRGERLGIVVGSGDQENLVPTGRHEFRTGNGRIQFDVAGGKARGLKFLRSDGRAVHAKRR